MTNYDFIDTDAEELKEEQQQIEKKQSVENRGDTFKKGPESSPSVLNKAVEAIKGVFK